MTFGKFLLRTFVGLLIGYFALDLSASDISLLMQGAVVIVVCTGGLGLLFLPIPILIVLAAAYGVGLLCTVWFIPFGRGEAEILPVPNAAQLGVKYKIAIDQYVSKAQGYGYDWPQTRRALEKGGFPESDLVYAYEVFKRCSS